MNMFRKLTLGVALLGALSLASVSLVTTGCSSHATLDPTGVYKGDKFVADTEASITSAYEVIDAFLKWELTNRPLLASQPQITRAADRIRAQAPRWFQSAHNLLDAYKAAPNDANKVNAQQALSILQVALTEVAAYMAIPLPPQPPSPPPAR